MANSKPHSIYIDDDVWEEIRINAVKENTTASEIIRTYIKKCLNEEREQTKLL